MAEQTIPLKISIAPFPEGFSGDMDETFQQACQLMEATVEGSFLTGLILPPGSTLPSSDVGPIVMDGVWYFWDPVTEQYLPQSISARPVINFVKNSIYQVRQTGDAPTVGAGVNRTYDMVITRSTAGTILSIAADAGPTATPDHDTCQSAIKYTVTNPVVSPAATDFYAHEHVIEGSDIAPIQGEILSLSFLCWVNQPGTYSVYLTNDARDASYVATFAMSAASTWARVKIEGIPAIPLDTGTWSFSEGTIGLSIGIPFCIGSQWQTVSANLKTWQGGFFAGVATQTNMCAVSNNQMKITAMRLEALPQTGYASINSFAQDYYDCIRYYFTTFNYQNVTTGVPMNLNAPGNGLWVGSMLFPRRMNKVPIITPFSYGSGAAGQLYNLAALADIPVATLAATQKGVIDEQNALISTTGTITSLTFTGNLARDSATVINIPSVATLSVGMLVVGAGILPNTFIDAIGTNTGIVSPANTTANSVSVLVDTTTLSAGMSVSGSGIIAGTIIDYIVSSASLILSKPAAQTYTGTSLTFLTPAIYLSKAAGDNGTGVTLNFVGFSITGIPSTAGMQVGQLIAQSTYIAPGTTITAIVSGTSINVSRSLLYWGTGVPLTVYQVVKGDVLSAQITADARL